MARVMVVEDQESERLLMRTVLMNAGHEVIFAKEGEEAVKTFLRRQPEVVITDLQMPNVDGLELIEELLALFPDTPIIAVSGKAKEHLETAKLIGARAILPKPIDKQALLKAVDSAAAEPGARRDF